jgi:MFS family permease
MANPRPVNGAPGDNAAWASTALYAQTAIYSFTLGMLMLLVPLYILSLGYNIALLGLIIAAQGVFQVGLRLFGGVFADRVGERWVIQASLGSLLAGSLILALFEPLALLIAAQLFLGASRSVYWTSAQSYGSRIDEAKSSVIIGRFFGWGSGGQLFGTVISGFLPGTIGFAWGFAVCAALAVASMGAVVIMPDLPRKAARSMRQVLAPVPSMFRSRATILPAILGFGASLIVALITAIIPAFYQEAGYSDETIGLFRAMHGVGAVAAGFLFGVALSRIGQRPMYAIILVGGGLSLILTVVSGDLLWTTMLVMFASGATFNAGRVLYASMTAEMSTPEQRGVAMAVLGIYWASAQLIGPAAFGVIANIVGLSAAITAAGVLVMAMGMLTPVFYRLFPSGGAAARRSPGGRQTTLATPEARERADL